MFRGYPTREVTSGFGGDAGTSCVVIWRREKGFGVISGVSRKAGMARVDGGEKGRVSGRPLQQL